MELGKKVVAPIVLFLVVAAALIAILLQKPTEDKWTTRLKQIDEMKLEARRRTLPHSRFQGELTPGNAWDDYTLALNDIETWKHDETPFVGYLSGRKGVDHAAVEKLVAEHAGVLEHLRRGARRSDGQYPYKWEQRKMQLPNPTAVRHLGILAAAQARILTSQGKTQEAVDLLLDVTVLGRDLATNSPLTANMAGLAVYATAFDEMRQLLLSRRPTATQLLELRRKLEVVERDFPTLGGGFARRQRVKVPGDYRQ